MVFFLKIVPKSPPPPPFLLHFLIHIDVFMLCRKFELIPTEIFQVIAIFKKYKFSEKMQRL